MEIPENHKKNLYWVVFVFIIILSLYYVGKIFTEFKSYSIIDKGYNVITLSGHGEVTSVPDMASIYFTIQKNKKTVKEAQAEVALVEKQALDFLRGMKIEDKDIKASNTSFYPKYEYVYGKTACIEYYCPPHVGRNVIVGYESTENITVKIRNIDDVGKIIEGLGKLAVSELNGPNFTIDNEDELKAQARKMAIDEAKIKAIVLARDLGVKLGKIISFNEGGDYRSYDGEAMMKTSNQNSAGAPTPEIPKGVNTITSDVSITYEVK